MARSRNAAETVDKASEQRGRLLGSGTVPDALEFLTKRVLYYVLAGSH